ncbi:conserved hypothetical protein [Halomonas sp. A3H3]|uniref:hypothetical protein n=1 Tax=Halomonas sp. A3H3 TaxID=1346287 RepID=UPI00038C9169|nr:hypothetical protein [Halomonas sp. A3H3]CDG51083.1 conserved hypothetical protein [Halomonas sp. A3H3]
MVTNVDRENTTKAAQCAAMLSSDLKAVAASDDPLLAELGQEALELAIALEKRLERLESLVSE